MHAYLVAGLAFGDEGKGTITDYLVRQTNAGIVVRYNGGPQAAHHVHTDDGRMHRFQQFGSGTFAGAKTYLSRFMLIEPFALFNEAEVLAKTLGRDPLKDLMIEEDCVICTPFHWLANKTKEVFRGDARHGSCGFGVGETRNHQINFNLAVRAKDIWNPDLLRSKLELIRHIVLTDLKNYEHPASRFYIRQIEREDIDQVISKYRQLEDHVVSNDLIATLSPWTDAVVFEGAQGMLLDETHGFAPYNTWTDITFNNAMELLTAIQPETITKIGVLRTYYTRHGAGPFPTERPGMSFPDDNCHNDWQGAFRFGDFDWDLARYAIDKIGGVDGLALTHVDQCDSIPVSGSPDVHILAIGWKLGVPVVITSHGPAPKDKFTVMRPEWLFNMKRDNTNGRNQESLAHS